MRKLVTVFLVVVGSLLWNAAFAAEGILLAFSSDVLIPNYSGSFTDVYPDVTVYDTEGMEDPAYPGKIVIPQHPNFTYLEIEANLAWDYSPTAGLRQIQMALERNGAMVPVPGRLNVKEDASLAGQNFIQHGASAAIPVQPGDIISFRVLQTSGASLNLKAIDSTWIYARGVNLR